MSKLQVRACDFPHATPVLSSKRLLLDVCESHATELGGSKPTARRRSRRQDLSEQKCELCGRIFKGPQGLKTHRTKMHVSEGVTSQDHNGLDESRTTDEESSKSANSV